MSISNEAYVEMTEKAMGLSQELAAAKKRIKELEAEAKEAWRTLSTVSTLAKFP